MSRVAKDIFVFGSNLRGRHGAGAALTAVRRFGAELGVCVGHIGQSYAIPTKDHELHPLGLYQVEHFVSGFIEYAHAHPDFTFNVTRIGCGYAKFKDHEIAPLFKDAPITCSFDPLWERYLSPLRKETNYWIGPL